MVSYEILSGVSAAALLFGWLYHKERKQHQRTNALAIEATSFYVSKVTSFEPNAPSLWMYECCNTFVLFNRICQRGSEFFLMEDGAIKARLTLAQPEIEQALSRFNSVSCPVEDFDSVELFG